MPRKKFGYYLLSDPHKGIVANLTLTPEWTATLTKFFGERDYTEELNADTSWLADLVHDLKASNYVKHNPGKRKKDSLHIG